MEVREISIGKLIPYDNNPRRNDESVPNVMASIAEFGFRVPIIVNAEYVVIAGHTRLKAAEQLGMEKVPCIVVKDLSKEQEAALRIADNKTAELSEWDYEKLKRELAEVVDIDMTELGFSAGLMEDLDSLTKFDLGVEGDFKITIMTDDSEAVEKCKAIAESYGMGVKE